jgi:predicted RNA-binding protein with PIN domain
MCSQCSVGLVIVLVDGRNVQRSRWPNVSSEELVAAVERWAATEGAESVVVFDGGAPEGAVGTGAESADDWITRRAFELAAAGESYWLVTSDRELRERAGGEAEQITGGGGFLSLLGLARR